MQSRIFNGRYQIEDVLGRGGMATVYRARDLKLGRLVAVKVLHDFYASDPTFLRRFEQEAQSVANISAHPNIVDVYDVGQEADSHYIVMEYVEGQSLRELIDQQGVLPVEQAIRIAQQVAEGLEAAHRHGLVHRDIKPQNIIVSPDGQVRLADFGIAKGVRSPGLTDPGMTFGTAEYISPEQVQGAGTVPQSDIYSLGVVLYEMLTGQLPFTGDSPLAIAMQHVQSDPVPLRQLNPQVPPQLEALVLQAMDKDPALRPASARSFAEDLRNYRERGVKQTIAGPAVARPPARPRQEPGPRYPRADTPSRRPAPLPLLPALEEPPRSSSGCAVFVLGMALLAGVLGLLYVVLATDFLDRVATFFPSSGPSATSAPASGGTPPTLQASPTAAPAATPTSAPTEVALVAVPRVEGLSDAEARRVLEQAGLGFATNPPVNDASVPQGIVAVQDIPSGTEVPKGTIVTYTVSLGPALVTLPRVIGQPFDAARATLEQQGLQVTRQDQPNAGVPAGAVISQNPGDGVQVPAGTNVTLVVSLGDVVVFPNVIGKQREEAEAILRASDGLGLEFVDEQGPDRLPGFESFRPNEVVSATANGQPVSNGQIVPRGSRIVIGVRRP